MEQEKDVRRRGPRTEAWASSVLVQGGSYSVYDSLKDCVVPYDHRTCPNFTQCLDLVLSADSHPPPATGCPAAASTAPGRLSMGTASPTTYCLLTFTFVPAGEGAGQVPHAGAQPGGHPQPRHMLSLPATCCMCRSSNKCRRPASALGAPILPGHPRTSNVGATAPHGRWTARDFPAMPPPGLPGLLAASPTVSTQTRETPRQHQLREQREQDRRERCAQLV